MRHNVAGVTQFTEHAVIYLHVLTQFQHGVPFVYISTIRGCILCAYSLCTPRGLHSWARETTYENLITKHFEFSKVLLTKFETRARKLTLGKQLSSFCGYLRTFFRAKSFVCLFRSSSSLAVGRCIWGYKCTDEKRACASEIELWGAFFTERHLHRSLRRMRAISREL